MRGPLTALGPAMQVAGWLALAIGAVLLVLHYAMRRIAGQAPIERPQAPRTKRSATLPPTPAASWREPTFAPDTVPAPQVMRSTGRREPESQWSPAVLAAIEWRRFEALCEAFYAQAGLATRSQSHGADGGVDIWLQSRHMDAPRIVQCKHWLGKPVGVKEMREFRGVMASHQLQNGTYVTSSTFTSDATAFRQSERHPVARRRGAAQADRPAHARAAGSLAGGRSRGRVLEADVRELRHQDGRAGAQARWRQVLGLQQLSAVQIPLCNALGLAVTESSKA